MLRRIALRTVEETARTETNYAFSLPVVIARTQSDKDVKVTRGDLSRLCDLIISKTAGMTGTAALVIASRVIRSWVAARPALEGSDWQRYLRGLSRGLASLAQGKTKTPFKVFANGNGKLPFKAFSTLPVYTCPGAGECAQWCYSFRAWRYPTAFCRQLQNTLLLWFAPNHIRDAFLSLPTGITVRLYVDGDFSSLSDISLWMDCLSARPDIKAYGYSKSWDLLSQWDRDNAGQWPTNYALNLSSGGRNITSVDQMKALPITRGLFVCVPIKGRYKGKRGFARYEDKNYYRAVRQAAKDAGYGKVFACPGLCGDCTGKGHACGMDAMKNVVIVNGEH